MSSATKSKCRTKCDATSGVAASGEQYPVPAQAQVAVLDLHGTIILTNEPWNRAARGHACCCCIEGAQLGAKYLALLARTNTGRELRSAIHAVQNGEKDSFCREFPCSSKTTNRWFQFAVTRVAAPGLGVIICRVDVTREKQGDDARAHLAAIVNSSTDAITAATLDGVVTSWNTGAEQIYGYCAKEMVGRSISRIVPRNRQKELQEVRLRLRHGEQIPPFETFRRHKDGRILPVALTLSAIRDVNNNLVGASGIARDVSDRRELEAEVLRAGEHEKRRIAEDLHDGLAQHLSGITCLADVLQQQLEAGNEPQSAAARKISVLLHQATDQARRLARGLYPVPADARGLISALHELATRTRDLYGIACAFQPKRTVPVYDPHVANHLYRIAQEAVTNAIRHARPKHIEILLMANRNQLVLGVRDDGIGIRHTPRKGIGLRIMSYRAHLLAGTLAVQHNPGGGTEVLCTVDRKSYEQPTSRKET